MVSNLLPVFLSTFLSTQINKVVHKNGIQALKNRLLLPSIKFSYFEITKNVISK